MLRRGLLTLSFTALLLSVASTQAPATEPRPPSPYVALRGEVHLQDLGDKRFRDGWWAGTKGQSRRLEAFSVAFAERSRGVRLEYMCHVQDIGDLPPGGLSLPPGAWTREGETCGTEGQSKRLEGFAIRLIGRNAENYDVFYECHVQDRGNLGPYKNGAFCGTTGESRRVEALRVWVLRNNLR